MIDLNKAAKLSEKDFRAVLLSAELTINVLQGKIKDPKHTSHFPVTVIKTCEGLIHALDCLPEDDYRNDIIRKLKKIKTKAEGN